MIPISCTWLTRQQAADYLQIKKNTLEKWDMKGKTKPWKSGKVVRYCLTDLLKLGIPSDRDGQQRTAADAGYAPAISPYGVEEPEP